MSLINFRFTNSTRFTLYIGWNNEPSIVTVPAFSESGLHSAELDSTRMFPLVLSSDEQISMPILLIADELPHTLPMVLQQVARNENWAPVPVSQNGYDVWTFNIELDGNGILIVGTVEVVASDDLVAAPTSSLPNR